MIKFISFCVLFFERITPGRILAIEYICECTKLSVEDYKAQIVRSFLIYIFFAVILFCFLEHALHINYGWKDFVNLHYYKKKNTTLNPTVWLKCKFYLEHELEIDDRKTFCPC